MKWRHEQASDADRLAGHAQSLFRHLDAHNVEKTWNYTSYLRKWNAACTKAGESISPQAGTRHSILSRLAEVLTPYEFQDQSQHWSLQSLPHYTTEVRANHAAMVKAIRAQHGK
jgi:hypothetical protein